MVTGRHVYHVSEPSWNISAPYAVHIGVLTTAIPTQTAAIANRTLRRVRSMSHSTAQPAVMTDEHSQSLSFSDAAAN